MIACLSADGGFSGNPPLRSRTHKHLNLLEDGLITGGGLVTEVRNASSKGSHSYNPLI